MRVLAILVVGCHSSAQPDVPHAAIDAGVEASIVDASTAAALIPVEAGACVVGGKPCNPHCASIAAKYLALPPDDGRCDPKVCGGAGGVCGYAGFCFGLACIRHAKDDGKTCADGAQCESGGCVAPKGAATGTIAKGTCAAPVLLLGCHAMIQSGVVMATICGD